MFFASMILGLIGLIAMAVLGLNHGHGTTTHGHSSIPDHGLESQHANHDSGGTRWLTWFSPRVIFSLALGFGAVGLVGEHVFSGLIVMFLAILGALLLERCVIRPYWDFLLRFASRPGQTLESTTFARAKAVMDFDASGSGLIELELDGQVRQVLGTLHNENGRVARGESLRVERVLASGNCLVSRLR